MGHLEMQALDEVSGVCVVVLGMRCAVVFWSSLSGLSITSVSDNVLLSLSFDFSSVVVQREELFAALDEVTENHMTLKGQLDEARAINRERVMEREEAEEECKEVSYMYFPTIVTRDAARVSESSTTMRALRRSEAKRGNVTSILLIPPFLPPPLNRADGGRDRPAEQDPGLHPAGDVPP